MAMGLGRKAQCLPRQGTYKCLPNNYEIGYLRNPRDAKTPLQMNREQGKTNKTETKQKKETNTKKLKEKRNRTLRSHHPNRRKCHRQLKVTTVAVIPTAWWFGRPRKELQVQRLHVFSESSWVLCLAYGVCI